MRDFIYRLCMLIAHERMVLAFVFTLALKLAFPSLFSWAWLGGWLIVWAVAGVILVMFFFDEISGVIEP